VERNGTSEATFTRMKNLLRTNVNMQTESMLPSRVLDIQGNSTGHVRLRETRGRHGRYAALSHCWGSSQHFTTIGATLKERLTSIEIAQRPKTFQDAIAVARGLALPYLWIDSLCIVQQNNEDWEAESPKMAEYYGNACITIAAANSTADTKGFLCNRSGYVRFGDAFPLDTIYADECSLSELYISDKAHQLYLKKVDRSPYDKFDSDSDPVRLQPLQRRAWTLQERYLSKQILHFGCAQNYLEANLKNTIFYEDGQKASGTQYWPKLHSPEQALPFQRWYDMLCEFSTRDITNKSDTFPALSGIAQRLAEHAGERYVAGLWKSDLARGLLWRTHPDATVNHKYESESYRAPSWSWASCDGRVSFLVNHLENEIDPDSWTNGHDHGPDSIDIFLITNVEANSEPFGPDRFGRLKSASLSLTAPILKINNVKKHEPSPGSRGNKHTIEVPMTDAQTYIGNAYLDHPTEDLDILKTHTLAVFISYTMGPIFLAPEGAPFSFKNSFGIGVFEGAFRPGFSTDIGGIKLIPQNSFTEENNRNIRIV
jgi:hypothetical protein